MGLLILHLGEREQYNAWKVTGCTKLGFQTDTPPSAEDSNHGAHKNQPDDGGERQAKVSRLQVHRKSHAYQPTNSANDSRVRAHYIIDQCQK